MLFHFIHAWSMREWRMFIPSTVVSANYTEFKLPTTTGACSYQFDQDIHLNSTCFVPSTHHASFYSTNSAKIPFQSVSGGESCPELDAFLYNNWFDDDDGEFQFAIEFVVNSKAAQNSSDCSRIPVMFKATTLQLLPCGGDLMLNDSPYISGNIRFVTYVGNKTTEHPPTYGDLDSSVHTCT